MCYNQAIMTRRTFLPTSLLASTTEHLLFELFSLENLSKEIELRITSIED